MAERRWNPQTIGRALIQGAAFVACFAALRYGVKWALTDSPMAGWSTTTQLVVAPIVIFTVAIVVVGPLVALMGMSNIVRSMVIRPGRPDGWPPASFALQDRFTRLGFEQFGSIEVEFPDHTAVFAGLLSPDGGTMAVISPAHMSFVTDYDGKLLTTTSQPAGAPNSYELRQSMRHGSPEELWALHEAGLGVAAANGLSPTTYSALSAMPALVHIEEYSKVDYSTWQQLKYLVTKAPTAGRTRSLASNRRAAELLASWWKSPHRWQPRTT